jgi:hypothetical protein
MSASDMTAKTNAPTRPSTAKSLRRATNILPEEGGVDRTLKRGGKTRPVLAKERVETPFARASSRIFKNKAREVPLSNRNTTSSDVGKRGHHQCGEPRSPSFKQQIEAIVTAHIAINCCEWYPFGRGDALSA